MRLTDAIANILVILMIAGVLLWAVRRILSLFPGKLRIIEALLEVALALFCLLLILSTLQGRFSLIRLH